MTDSLTRRWMRDASDEFAVSQGCWFDEQRGQYVVDWIERVCRLYEGEWAGQPMVLGDWQYEATMRLFGWQRHSEKWGRAIRRFRRASIWIAKKNAKTPTAAAWALYLLAGDGEQGQRVYLAAKDGAQARMMVGTHAMEMAQLSPVLNSALTINKNLMRVMDPATRSYLQPLSSSNSRTQEAKEGLNGSVVIDECHVVDREFVNRISRAGISRSEPLHIEVSTAGNNPDGYGMSQFEYGRQVAAGEVRDSHLLYLAYCAPQKLTDEELAKDPLKYGKMANPAMGRIVDPEEFLADYERSKRSLSDLALFRMYRLNIWQQSANPWLKLEDWHKCQSEFSADDLVGEQCWAALDLGRTRDMTALCLAFPDEGERVKFLWWFWLPEAYAREHSDKAPLLSLAADERCNLILTPGDVLDLGYVRSQIRDLSEQYYIEELVYDDWNAEQITQEISEGYTDINGRTEPGLNIERIKFSQSLKNFNEPTKEFERRVITGDIQHNGDPCMTWQIGHCMVYEDRQNRNIRPVKPAKDDVRKIDGVVVAIMALARAMGRESEYWDPADGVAI